MEAEPVEAENSSLITAHFDNSCLKHQNTIAIPKKARLKIAVISNPSEGG